MEVKFPRCAGLDVHSRVVVACVRVADGKNVTHEIESFGTTTKELGRLAEFLEARGCTVAAMEATGVYWRPVWHVLEGSIELMLVNAREFHNVPGRKTDANDAEWLSDLLAHGLLRSSLVPPQPQQEIRDLTRTRKQLVHERARHVQRIQKVLEAANIKLSTVLADILGQTGRRILDAIVAGTTDAEALADLRSRRVKASKDQLIDALRGRPREHHRFELRVHLKLIDTLDASIDEIDERLQKMLEPFRIAVERLKTIPGVGDSVAEVVVGEVGVDMTRFPSAAHLRSWAGLCPHSDESAGKRRSARLRKSGTWLKPTLVQASLAAIKVQNSYLQALYRRIRGRRGHQKAIMAVAASMLTAAYHMLKRGVDYADLGGAYFDEIDRHHAAQRHLRRLRELGFQVSVTEAPAAA
jgi:transposase